MRPSTSARLSREPPVATHAPNCSDTLPSSPPMAGPTAKPMPYDTAT